MLKLLFTFFIANSAYGLTLLPLDTLPPIVETAIETAPPCAEIKTALDELVATAKKNDQAVADYFKNTTASLHAWHQELHLLERQTVKLPAGVFSAVEMSKQNLNDSSGNILSSSSNIGITRETLIGALTSCTKEPSVLKAAGELGQAIDELSEVHTAFSAAVADLGQLLQNWYGKWRPQEEKEWAVPEKFFATVDVNAVRVEVATQQVRDICEQLEQKLIIAVNKIKGAL